MRVDDVTADPAKRGREMKEVVLREGMSISNELLQLALAAVRGAGRVYRTEISFPGAVVAMEGDFLTGSKDIHLKLGLLSKKAHWELADLIRQTSNSDREPFLLFLDQTRSSAVFVSVSRDAEGKITAHLSPAN